MEEGEEYELQAPGEPAKLVSERPAPGPKEDTALVSAGPKTTTIPEAEPNIRTVGWVHLTFIAYAFTAAGPFGMEPAVRAGGPLIALIGLFTVPILYVVPQIIIVTEMVSLMPTTHGGVLWVQRAFGDFWGYFCGMTLGPMGLVDTAVYPNLFAAYIMAAFYPHGGYWVKVMLATICLWIGTGMALLSAKAVSKCAAFLSFLVVTPFIVGVFAGIHLVDRDCVHRIEPFEPQYDFGLLLSTLAWMFTGWANLGTLGGEVSSPRVFLIGMPLALTLGVLTYVFPLLIAVSVPVPPNLPEGPWHSGYLSSAFEVVLPGLGTAISIAGALGSIGLLSSAMLCYPRTVWGIAERGWLPHFLTKRSRTGAPWAAVALHFCVASVLVFVSFESLVRIEMTVTIPNTIMCVLCLARLRYKEPDAPRTFRWPKSNIGACILSSVPILLFLTLFVMNMKDWQVTSAGVIVDVIAALSYLVYKRARKARKNPEEAGQEVVLNSDDLDKVT